MAAPKARPINRITLQGSIVEITTSAGELFLITNADRQYGYPTGDSFHLYHTELAQVSARLARHFQLPWQVKYTNANGDAVFTTTEERIAFIYDTAVSKMSNTESIDISEFGPWKYTSVITGHQSNDTAKDQTADSQPPTKEEASVATGTLEQIIGDMIDARIKTSDAPLNEEAVRTIVQDALATRPADKLEIKFPDGTKTMLEKHTHPQFVNVLKVVTLARQSTKWPYLVGPAGTGKSTMGEHLAEALGVPFLAFPANPGAMMHDILGFVRPTDGVYDEPPYVTLMRTGGLLLLDELDKLHPGIAAGMNGMLAQMRVTLPNGESFALHDKFFVVAGANTFGTGATAEYVGSTQLDAATLNRFARISMDYDREYEKQRACAVLGDSNGAKWVRQIEQMRENRDAHKIQAIISTRDVMGVATLVAGGVKGEDALDWCILAGLNNDQRSRLTANTNFGCLEASK